MNMSNSIFKSSSRGDGAWTHVQAQSTCRAGRIFKDFEAPSQAEASFSGGGIPGKGLLVEGVSVEATFALHRRSPGRFGDRNGLWRQVRDADRRS
jgi:hypothetical protein